MDSSSTDWHIWHIWLSRSKHWYCYTSRVFTFHWQKNLWCDVTWPCVLAASAWPQEVIPPLDSLSDGWKLGSRFVEKWRIPLEVSWFYCVCFYLSWSVSHILSVIYRTSSTFSYFVKHHLSNIINPICFPYQNQTLWLSICWILSWIFHIFPIGWFSIFYTVQPPTDVSSFIRPWM